MLTGAVDIDGGEFHSLAVLKSGVVMAWGYNSLGQGSANTEFFPVLVAPTDTFLRVGAR